MLLAGQGILVIGGTGAVGRAVIAQLPREIRVSALVRNPLTARLPRQVLSIPGDLTRPETLDKCLDGIDAVFLVWCAPPEHLEPALERIFRRARRIVFLSAPLKTAHPFFQQSNPLREVTAKIERLIEASGLEWTFLRPGMFAENALRWWVPQIRAGDVVRWPYLGAATAPIDVRDIAAVGVRALCHGGYGGAEYVLTGPESLNQAEQILTIGRATGRALRAEEISPEEARRELLPLLPGFVLDMLMNAWAASKNLPAFVTSTVEEITGTPARTFFEWACDHRDRF